MSRKLICSPVQWVKAHAPVRASTPKRYCARALTHCTGGHTSFFGHSIYLVSQTKFALTLKTNKETGESGLLWQTADVNLGNGCHRVSTILFGILSVKVFRIFPRRARRQSKRFGVCAVSIQGSSPFILPL